MVGRPVEADRDGSGQDRSGAVMSTATETETAEPSAWSTVKEAVRAVDTVDAQQIVKAVLASDGAASVRARLNGD